MTYMYKLRPVLFVSGMFANRYAEYVINQISAQKDIGDSWGWGATPSFAPIDPSWKWVRHAISNVNILLHRLGNAVYQIIYASVAGRPHCGWLPSPEPPLIWPHLWVPLEAQPQELDRMPLDFRLEPPLQKVTVYFAFFFSDLLSLHHVQVCCWTLIDYIGDVRLWWNVSDDPDASLGAYIQCTLCDMKSRCNKRFLLMLFMYKRHNITLTYRPLTHRDRHHW